MSEWLRWWVNLSVTPPLSAWEVVGSNPTAGISRIGFKKFPNVSLMFLIHSPTNKITFNGGLFVAVCNCCKVNEV